MQSKAPPRWLRPSSKPVTSAWMNDSHQITDWNIEAMSRSWDGRRWKPSAAASWWRLLREMCSVGVAVHLGSENAFGLARTRSGRSACFPTPAVPHHPAACHRHERTWLSSALYPPVALRLGLHSTAPCGVGVVALIAALLVALVSFIVG